MAVKDKTTTNMIRQKRNLPLVDELREKDELLQNSPSIVGMSGLTFPSYINAMRSTMFTSHLKQFVNLLNPEFPQVFTNNENIVGKYSVGYKKAKEKLEVVAKVVKFEDIIDTTNFYNLFTFDAKNKHYDVYERKVCESLTENFGYEYNNTYIDKLKVGDTIDKDAIIYASTSYDEDMNYGYGLNVTVGYTLDPYTSEDAAIASDYICEKFKSIETEGIVMNINSNVVLLDLYGKDGEYKPLPDIGTIVNDKLAVSRVQFNNQLLYDFKDTTLNEIHDEDNIYYINKNSEIIDYNIYNNNNEERNESPFYTQINKYLDSQTKYWEEIYDVCKGIIDECDSSPMIEKEVIDTEVSDDSSDEHKTKIVSEHEYTYSREIDYLYKRAKEMLDTNKSWKRKDSVFNNMEIEVIYRRICELAVGTKISGRYGNKSVISKKVPREKMPYTEDGRRVDILLNLLAIINRTTSYPLYEIFITGSAYKVQQYMKTLKTDEEKLETLFKFIGILNVEEEKKQRKIYRKMNKQEKKEYLDGALNDLIYIHEDPIWEDELIFYKCQKLREAFPCITEDTLYINKWGRKIKVLSKYFIGNMYIMKLKQTDRRGFSARSTGTIDNKSLPTRSFKSRSHLEKHSTSSIRFGEYETINFTVGLQPKDIVLFHALYRTSIKGRQDLIKMMFNDDNTMNGVKEIDKYYTSRVAEIFYVWMKCLGMGIDFIDDKDYLQAYDSETLCSHNINGTVYFCTDYEAYIIGVIEDVKKEIFKETSLITSNRLKEMIIDRLKMDPYISANIDDEIDVLNRLYLPYTDDNIVEK